MKKRASGDRLDGFSQSHFIRQQRALLKSQVQHPFSLIGVKRNKRFMRRPLPCLNFLLVLPDKRFPFVHLSLRSEPWLYFLRDAKILHPSLA